MSDTNKEFLNLMESMRSHYKKSNVERFTFKQNFKALKNSSDLEKIVGPIQSDAQARHNEFDASSQKELTNTTEWLVNSSGSIESKQDIFRKRMERIRKEQKAKAEANIDKYIDKMIDAGTKHPKQQNAIVRVTDSTLNFLNNALSVIGDFVVQLVNKIASWVSEAFRKIGEFFSNAAKSTANFFSSIFSFAFLEENIPSEV